jgi:ferric-dicitrate binding protein FerR (iron transport regulator)
MSRFKGLFARFRTTAEPDAEARLRERVLRSHARILLSKSALAPLGDVPPASVTRVRRRLDAPRRPVVDGRRMRGFAGLLALVALTALFAAVRLPAPDATRLSARLEAHELREDTLTPAVGVSYQGSGDVSGTDRAPTIRWETGGLHVAVTPGAGVALSVETAEAVVRVVGTVFDVTRDALGTRVDVTRGHVVVACTRGAPQDLYPGDTTTCLPARPLGLLGRARALAEAGAPSNDVLATLTLGLSEAGPGDDAARDELTALEVAALARAGRRAEARRVADGLLAAGAGVRRGAVARIAGQIALDAEGCAAALPYLEAIPSPERTADDEAARLACGAPPAPETP